MSVHLGACPTPPPPPPPLYQKAGYATVARFCSPEEWPNEDGRFRPPHSLHEIAATAPNQLYRKLKIALYTVRAIRIRATLQIYLKRCLTRQCCTITISLPYSSYTVALIQSSTFQVEMYKDLFCTCILLEHEDSVLRNCLFRFSLLKLWPDRDYHGIRGIITLIK